jgi:uncharacterized protein YodC (DUF2158 family)
MMDAFQPGDLVQLKSGGPIMTVERISPDGSVLAVWFAYLRRCSRSFTTETLQAADATRSGVPQ